MSTDFGGYPDPNGLFNLASSSVVVIGANTSNSSGTRLTAGSANTKGSWVVLSSSTPIETNSIEITMLNGSSVTQYLVDIAVGGVGSEVTIIPNLFYRNSDGSAISAAFPLTIPRGSTISARCQSATGSATVDVLAHISGFSPYRTQYTGVVDIGTLSSGTTDLTGAVTSGTANTLSAWSAFSKTATRQIELACFCVDTGNSTNSTLFDYAVGSGSDYAMKIQQLAGRGNASNAIIYTTLLPFYVPQGSSLFWRFQNTVVTGSYGTTAIYGLYR